MSSTTLLIIKGRGVKISPLFTTHKRNRFRTDLIDLPCDLGAKLFCFDLLLQSYAIVHQVLYYRIDVFTVKADLGVLGRLDLNKWSVRYLRYSPGNFSLQ